MDGVEIILYSSSWVPDNVNVCLQCRLNDTSTSETCHFELSKKHHWASNLNLTASWLTKPVAYWRIIPRTGKSPHVQATGKVNRDRLVAYWRIIPRTGKLSHVQATKQKWSACGLLKDWRMIPCKGNDLTMLQATRQILANWFIDYRSRLEVAAGLFFTTLLLMRCSGSRLTSGIPSCCLVKSIQTIAPRGWKYGFGML